MADTIKGRGSRQYLPGRFETTTVEAADDGWAPLAEPEAGPDPSRPRTEVQEEIARSIVTRNRSPDVGFSQSVNPYRGCEHGCSYCFARPSHAYLNLSPGLDFETKIFAKTNAPELLRREFARPGYRPSPIALGINTDAYQPVERRLQLTRRLVEVMLECRHPFSLVTKNALVERDLDLLQPLAALGLVHVYFSVTTLDPQLSARLEPRAAAPQAPATCSCACRTRSPRCSAIGSRRTCRTAPRGSWRPCARCAGGGTTSPGSARACAAAAPMPTCSSGASRSPVAVPATPRSPWPGWTAAGSSRHWPRLPSASCSEPTVNPPHGVYHS